MSRSFITIGDQTDHGGVVVSSSAQTDIGGKLVARIGDRVSCPKCKGVFPIASGDATIIVDGQPVARHGDKTACGATLIAGQIQVFVDNGGGKGGSANDAAAVAAAVAVVSVSNDAKRYDEQIQFVNAKGAKLGGVDYALKLDDGTVVSGTADAEGKTRRVVTDAPTVIAEAQLTAKPEACCAMAAERMFDMSPLVVKANVATNATAVGSSFKTVATPQGESRGLTYGEIVMARTVFANAVNYSTVKIHKGEYLWFGMQPDDTAMTPDGEMYFNEKHFLEDFSVARIGIQQWFMHEMTHVWQYQLGYPVKTRGALRIGLSYAYELATNKRLGDFNMEAQGNILADYFVLKIRGSPGSMYEERYSADANALVLFEAVLLDFLRSPTDTVSLPWHRT